MSQIAPLFVTARCTSKLNSRRLTERLQPTRTAAFLLSKLRYHRIAVRASEPRDVRQTEVSVARMGLTLTPDEVVAWYRTRLANTPNRADARRQFDKRYEERREAATAEATVFHYLEVKRLNPSLLESPSTGGLDFECSDGEHRFAVEVTSFGDETVSERSRFPNALTAPGNIDMPAIVALVRSRVSAKAAQAKSYPGPRVLVVASTHVLASVIFMAGAEEFLTGQAGISFGVGPNGPVGESYMSTALENAAFIRRGENGVESFRPKHSLVLLFAIHGGGAHVTGIVHPAPEILLPITPFGNVPFARLRWPVENDKLQVEWVIAGPRPEQHYFIPLER